MSTISIFLKPFRFIWNRSQLLAPARTILEEAEDWTDAACVAGYVVLAVFLLYVAAISFSLEFLLALGRFAVAAVLLRIAFDRFF